MNDITNADRLKQLIDWTTSGKLPTVQCVVSNITEDEGHKFINGILKREWLILHIDRVRSIHEELSANARLQAVAEAARKYRDAEKAINKRLRIGLIEASEARSELDALLSALPKGEA